MSIVVKCINIEDDSHMLWTDCHMNENDRAKVRRNGNRYVHIYVHMSVYISSSIVSP